MYSEVSKPWWWELMFKLSKQIAYCKYDINIKFLWCHTPLFFCKYSYNFFQLFEPLKQSFEFKHTYFQPWSVHQTLKTINTFKENCVSLMAQIIHFLIWFSVWWFILIQNFFTIFLYALQIATVLFYYI